MFPKISGLIGEKRFDAACAILLRFASLPLSPGQRGEYLFHLTEIAREKGGRNQAFRLYGEALPLLEDNQRRSDALWKRAEWHRDARDRDAAVAGARRSVALVPDNEWRNIEAGTLFAGFGMHKEAAYYLERGLASGRVKDEDVYFAFPALASAHNQLGRRDCALFYTRRYIDAACAALAANPSPELGDMDAICNARRSHSLLSRRFGASLSTFYASFDNGDYMAQSYNELFYNAGTVRNVGVEAYLVVPEKPRFSRIFHKTETNPLKTAILFCRILADCHRKPAK